MEVLMEYTNYTWAYKEQDMKLNNLCVNVFSTLGGGGGGSGGGLLSPEMILSL